VGPDANDIFRLRAQLDELKKLRAVNPRNSVLFRADTAVRYALSFPFFFGNSLKNPCYREFGRETGSLQTASTATTPCSEAWNYIPRPIAGPALVRITSSACSFVITCTSLGGARRGILLPVMYSLSPRRVESGSTLVHAASEVKRNAAHTAFLIGAP
jgi:hypothetical protein